MTVTLEHEAPLELLERFPDLLPSLLREQLGRPVPLGARLRPVSENHNIPVVQELRSDGAFVLDLIPGQPPVCAAILEPQRRIDPEKWYSWPIYLSGCTLAIASSGPATMIFTWALAAAAGTPITRAAT